MWRTLNSTNECEGSTFHTVVAGAAEEVIVVLQSR
jgi:hypothetical protein